MSATPWIAPPPASSAPEAERFTRWHLLTLCLLICGYAGYYFCRSDFSVALPLLIEEQHRHGIPRNVAELRFGTIASAGVFMYAVGKFPSGMLADLVGGKLAILGGMLGAIVCTLLFMVSGTFPLFTIAWVANRLLQSLGWPGLVNVSSRWFSHSVYGTVMGLLSLSYLLGDAVSRGVMSLLLAHGCGWRTLFAMAACVMSVLLVLNLIFLKNSPREISLHEAQTNPHNLFAHSSEKGKGNAFQRNIAPLMHSRKFWIVCFLSLGTTLLRETFNLWTPTYFTQVLDLSASGAAMSSALFPLFGAFSVILAGAFSDRFRSVGRLRIVVASLFGSALSLLALAQIHDHSQKTASFVLVATIAFLLIGPYSYLAGAMSLDFGGREGSATASGIIDGVGYLAGALAGNSMVSVALRFGWQHLFLLLASIALVSAFIPIALQKPKFAGGLS